MSLGQNIYRLRTEKLMSQSELADALEVSRQSISKWETDASVPELDKLLALSELFEISLDELIKGEKPEGSAEKSEEKQEEPRYCLVLTDSIFDKESMIRVLRDEFDYSEERAKEMVACAPVVIKRGLRYRDAAAMERELREIAWTKILHDEDAWNPVKLREEKIIPPPKATPEEEEKKEGMSFGMTVLAVVIGVVVGILILSVF